MSRTYEFQFRKRDSIEHDARGGELLFEAVMHLVKELPGKTTVKDLGDEWHVTVRVPDKHHLMFKMSIHPELNQKKL